jgi:hypothetical protein
LFDVKGQASANLLFAKNKLIFESKLKMKIQNINIGFEEEKWERLKFLDWKSEFDVLSTEEEKEALELAEAYEEYSVERLKNISQLAILRGVTIDKVIEELGLNV